MTWVYALLLSFWPPTPEMLGHSTIASPKSSKIEAPRGNPLTPNPSPLNSTTTTDQNTVSNAINEPKLLGSSTQPSIPSTSQAPTEPTGTHYDAKKANNDVLLILNDRGKAYLQARARLEAHPELAKAALSSAVLSRLAPSSDASRSKIEAPERANLTTENKSQNSQTNQGHVNQTNRLELQGPSKRTTTPFGVTAMAQVELRRLLALLAIVDPESRELGRQLALQLRNSWQGPGKYSCDESQWCQLLISRGPIAFPEVRQLVADRNLATEARIELLDKLVDLAEKAELTHLAQQVGTGDPALDLQLRRALTRRAHRNASDTQVIRIALEQSMRNASPKQLARLVYLRSVVAPIAEPLANQFEAWASSNKTDFAVRIAAVYGLRASRSHRGHLRLVKLATYFLENLSKSPTAFELLAQTALEGLEDDQASPIIDRFHLQSLDSPRLATLGYSRGTIPPNPQWFARSQSHPWPEVRMHALTRIESGCPDATANDLKQIAGPISRGGAKHPGIGREAVFALGRCRTPVASSALRSLLANHAISFSRRNDAAKALIEYNGLDGAKAVAKILALVDQPEFAEKLAIALAQAESNSVEIEQSLCGIVRENGKEWGLARQSALKSLATLTNDASCRD